MEIVAFLAHANHHHTIVIDAEGRMPEFLEGFHKLMAKHQNVLRGRWENFWASEQTSVVELLGSEDILAKMTYVLTNPVKDHIVERADQWPGASSLRANLFDDVVSASRPWRFFRKDGCLPKSLTFRCVRPPGFDDLGAEQLRSLLKQRIRAAEKAADRTRKVRGVRVLGRRQVLRQRPTDRPTSQESRRGLNPRVASTDTWARVEALQRNRIFLAAYRLARDLWQSGMDTRFPIGTYWLRRFAGVPVRIEGD